MIGVPFYFMLKREVKRFMRVLGQTIITPIINTALYLLIFGVSIGHFIQTGYDVSYMMFILPGLVMMGVLNNAFQNSSSSITISKFNGDLEDLKVTPLTSHDVVWGKSLSSMLRGMLVGFVVAVVGALFVWFYEGGMLKLEHPLYTIVFLMLGGISLGQLGLCVGFVAKNFDQVSAFSTLLLLPLIYLGGVFFSTDNLHPFWQQVAEWNPILYYINGVRFGFLGVADVPVGSCLMLSFVTLLVTTALAYYSVVKGKYSRY